MYACADILFSLLPKERKCLTDGNSVTCTIDVAVYLHALLCVRVCVAIAWKCDVEGLVVVGYTYVRAWVGGSSKVKMRHNYGALLLLLLLLLGISILEMNMRLQLLLFGNSHTYFSALLIDDNKRECFDNDITSSRDDDDMRQSLINKRRLLMQNWN